MATTVETRPLFFAQWLKKFPRKEDNPKKVQWARKLRDQMLLRKERCGVDDGQYQDWARDFTDSVNASHLCVHIKREVLAGIDAKAHAPIAPANGVGNEPIVADAPAEDVGNEPVVAGDVPVAVERPFCLHRR